MYCTGRSFFVVYCQALLLVYIKSERLLTGESNIEKTPIIVDGVVKLVFLDLEYVGSDL